MAKAHLNSSTFRRKIQNAMVDVKIKLTDDRVFLDRQQNGSRIKFTNVRASQMKMARLRKKLEDEFPGYAIEVTQLNNMEKRYGCGLAIFIYLYNEGHYSGTFKMPDDSAITEDDRYSINRISPTEVCISNEYTGKSINVPVWAYEHAMNAVRILQDQEPSPLVTIAAASTLPIYEKE